MIHTMLPTQSVSKRGMRPSEPHKRLMAAVLQTVVDDCREAAARRQLPLPPASDAEARGVRKAIAYVASSDRVWPFSFENLCDALELDSQSLRAALAVEREVVAA